MDACLICGGGYYDERLGYTISKSILHVVCALDLSRIACIPNILHKTDDPTYRDSGDDPCSWYEQYDTAGKQQNLALWAVTKYRWPFIIQVAPAMEELMAARVVLPYRLEQITAHLSAAVCSFESIEVLAPEWIAHK